MGITRGHLRRLGFKPTKEGLEYKVNDEEKIVLGKGKTVMFVVRGETVIPLVHLQYTSTNEMFNFLSNIKNNSIYRLKEQLEEI